MLADPIVVAANSPTPALTLGIVKSDGFGSERWDVPNGYVMTISHQTNQKTGERHYVKLAQTLDATSPYTGDVTKQTAFVSLSVSIPPFGWDLAHKNALVQALLDTINDSQFTIAALNSFQS